MAVGGADALFLVIQHANLKTQEEYLPVMRESVNNGQAAPQYLAMLEDKVLVKQGKKQMYGSQIETDKDTQDPYSCSWKMNKMLMSDEPPLVYRR